MHNVFLTLLLVCVGISGYGQNNSWTLKGCIDYAHTNNFDVQKNTIANKLNNENLKQAKGNRIPSLAANGGQYEAFGRSIDPTTNLFVQQHISSNNMSLNSSIVLFNGFQTNNTVRQNRKLLEAGKYETEQMKNQVSLNIIAYYLQILLFKQQIQSGELQLTNTSTQIERIEKLLITESVTIDQLYKLNAQAAQDKNQIQSIHLQLVQAKINLCEQMQLNYTDDFDIAPLDINTQLLPNDRDSANTSPSIYQAAEERMPQILATNAKNQAGIYATKVARGTYYPKLSLTGVLATTYSSQNREVDGLMGYEGTTIGFVKDNPTLPVTSAIPVYSYRPIPITNQWEKNSYTYVGVELSIPILSYNYRRTNVNKTKINNELNKIESDRAKYQLKKDIDLSYQSYYTALEKSKASKERYEARNSSFLIDEKRFNAGTLSIYNYIEEKNQLLQSELQYIHDKYDLIFKKKILDFYKGTIEY